MTGGLQEEGCVSFLKGLWYPTDEGLCWGPAPSRLVKLGKASNDPRISFGTKDLMKATYLHAVSVADTYASFLQVPGLRGYVDQYSQGTNQVKEEWKIKSSFKLCNVKLLEDEASRIVQLRYGISPDEMALIERWYRSTSLFTFLVHPVFRKLSEVDYGK